MSSGILPTPDMLWHWTAQATGAAVAAAIAIAAALLAHLLLFAVLDRLTRLSQLSTDEVVVDRLRQPLRWSLIAVAISLAGEGQPALAHLWDSVARFVVPALLGWVAFALVKAFATAMDSRAELSRDELAARSRRTRIAILSRTAGFVIVFVTVALMLLGIPGVRNVGVTLMASAGLAGLAVGAAAQPALKSLIAGIQMALTEPIRIGDLIVIENETGRVEDIRMTYVVIRTADERRLIVPTAKFLDTTFQNWTRVAGGLTGTVVLPIAAGQPIAPIRAAFERLLAEHREWDRRTGALQVSEVKVDAVELKLMMSARDPASLATLRLAMREAMLEWLREEMPDALRGVTAE
ncbi:MAG TPA: mechanosensitive ion channel domain-containing protein [Novosphingobium sp.]|nr:mechanosensitive ion channel domain-containing protein [Novosphingobium sp.]